MFFRICHPPSCSLSLALILTVDRICISARSWHEHSNDFISSSTCTNAYLGNITYWADCPIYFLFSKHMRPYLISPIAYWETYLSYTSMEGHTHTHTLWGCVLQWCKPVDGLLPDDPNKTFSSGQYHRESVRTHSHRQAEHKFMSSLLHSTHGYNTLERILVPKQCYTIVMRVILLGR